MRTGGFINLGLPWIMTTNYTIKTLPDLEQVAPGRSGVMVAGL